MNKNHIFKLGLAFGFAFILILGLSGCFLLKNDGKDPDAAMVIDAFYECRNLEYVKELVEEGQVDVNGLVPFGSFFPKKVSPLYLMQVFRCDMRFIDYLLKKGADPDVAFGDTTLLMCALGADANNGAGYGPKLKEACDQPPMNSATVKVSLISKSKAGSAGATQGPLPRWRGMIYL